MEDKNNIINHLSFYNLITSNDYKKIENLILELDNSNYSAEKYECSFFSSKHEKKYIIDEFNNITEYLKSNLNLYLLYIGYLKYIKERMELINNYDSIAKEIKEELAILEIAMGIEYKFYTSLSDIKGTMEVLYGGSKKNNKGI